MCVGIIQHMAIMSKPMELYTMNISIVKKYIQDENRMLDLVERTAHSIVNAMEPFVGKNVLDTDNTQLKSVGWKLSDSITIENEHEEFRHYPTYRQIHGDEPRRTELSVIFMYRRDKGDIHTKSIHIGDFIDGCLIKIHHAATKIERLDADGIIDTFDAIDALEEQIDKLSRNIPVFLR